MGIGITLSLIVWLLLSVVVIIVYLIRVESLNHITTSFLEGRYGETYTFDRTVSIKGTQQTVVRLYVNNEYLEVKIDVQKGITDEIILSRTLGTSIAEH